MFIFIEISVLIISRFWFQFSDR